MKVAVYDRYWGTAGGGEKVAGGAAQVLSDEHEVFLLGNEPIDLQTLQERLNLDLRRVQTHIFDDTGSGALTAATEKYDLLINCSHLSADPCGAARGIYYVHFPTPFDHHIGAPQRAAVKLLRPFVRPRGVTLDWGNGFHLPEQFRLRRYRWTSEKAYLKISAPEGRRAEIHLTLGAHKPAGLEPAYVNIDVDGRMVRELEVGRKPIRVDLETYGQGANKPSVIGITSTVFVPSEVVGGSDMRRLGVQLLSVRVGDGLGSRIAAAYPLLATPPVSLDFLSSYDRVVANSEFTRRWVAIRWGRDSDLLYPPVTAIEPGQKSPVILSVGRFFDRKHGHSKKQLELVRAFATMHRSGLRGWELHLAGGVSDDQREYLHKIEREAHGLPVHIHIDASGTQLRELYSRASIFWHATGLGETAERTPHLMEHFGISTVEAMSAGAVPVVIAKGGQPEIVQEGVSGFLFADLEELVAKTHRIIEDPDMTQRVSSGARARSAEFNIEHFGARLKGIIDQIIMSA